MNFYKQQPQLKKAASYNPWNIHLSYLSPHWAADQTAQYWFLQSEIGLCVSWGWTKWPLWIRFPWKNFVLYTQVFCSLLTGCEDSGFSREMGRERKEQADSELLHVIWDWMAGAWQHCAAAHWARTSYLSSCFSSLGTTCWHTIKLASPTRY